MEGLRLLEKTPLNTPLTTNTKSLLTTPIQLSGFLNGDTVQVEGHTGDLQFSVQFNVLKRNHVVSGHTEFDSNGGVEKALENHCPFEKTSSSSYVTPNNIPDLELNESSHSEPLIVESNADNVDCFEECDITTRRVGMVTRLRSGAICALKYSGSELKSRERIRSEKGLLERVLRRHSLPVRPCSSYAFFVMATWGSIKSSSFGDTTKSLAHIWCKLPQKEKKVFEAMASKDSARYKRQCMLLKNETRKIKVSRKKSNRRNRSK